MFWYIFMVHRLSCRDVIVLGTWFALLPFEVGKLSTCSFQELCKTPSCCFGAWRVTFVKIWIFLSFFPNKEYKGTIKSTAVVGGCGFCRDTTYIPSHGMHLVWHLTNVLLNSFEKDQLNCIDVCSGSPSCKMACLSYSSTEDIYCESREWDCAAGECSGSICGLNQITGGTLLCIPESRRITWLYIVPGEQIDSFE